jgi:hypothetical protein
LGRHSGGDRHHDGRLLLRARERDLRDPVEATTTERTVERTIETTIEETTPEPEHVVVIEESGQVSASPPVVVPEPVPESVVPEPQPQSQVGPRPPTPPKPPLGCHQGGPYVGSSPINKTEAQVEAEWEAAGRPQVQEMPAWLKENIERAKGRS